MTRATAPVLLAVLLLCTQGPLAGRFQEGAFAQRERAYRANNIGVAHLEQFDYPGANRFFREALGLAPGLAIARLNLAIAQLYAGESAAALPEARQAAELLPDTPNAHFVLGLIARAEDDLEAAAAAFRRVLELDPADAGARIHLGQIHLQQRQFQEALVPFEEALAAEPYNVTAAYNRALALTRAGQTEDGRQAMQRFETLRDSAYGVTYSQTYLGQGRYGEALASTGAEPELVDGAPPDLTFSEASDTFLPKADTTAPAPGSVGAVTLFDLDGDGDLDLLRAGTGGLEILINEGGRFTPAPARLAGIRIGPAAGVVAGDYDNDERPDLFVLRTDGHSLLRQRENGTFEDVTAGASMPPAVEGLAAAAFGDVDHDGDLDIVAAGTAIQLLRNNGNGTFTDMTREAGLTSLPGRAVGVAVIDFDNRRDADILVSVSGGAPILFRNMRDGTFRNWAKESGLPPGSHTAVAIGDLNKDGYTDIFLGREADAGVLAMSDGRGGFATRPAPPDARGALAAQFVDIDNDGLLDLLTLSADGPRLFRNLGGDKWDDITARSRLSDMQRGTGPLQSLALGDLDGDGDRDIVVRQADGSLRVWRNDRPDRTRSLAVRLTSRLSNRSALGSKVEVRAGSLRQSLDVVSSTPAVAPADIIFGLGRREAADVVRVLWPSGILQAETELPPPGTPGSPVFEITELDRKPSSCPYLFTWNGTSFEFVTDFLGGGEMGAWLAPAVWNQPDPDEYVRIRGDQLQPRNGRYELRLTNELEEAVFLDRVQLLAIDHAAGTEVHPNEGLRSLPRPPFRLTAVADGSPPVRAVDGKGRALLARISSLDRVYADTFAHLPIRGYAEPHELILDLGAAADDAVLLMTGWTDYAFSNDNVAASQGGTVMSPPALQVRDSQGDWRTVIQEIGFPVGRPQTVAVDLSKKFLSSSREVRIVTNMRIYWDQILVGRPDASSLRKARRLDPLSADLRWRGFSAEVTPDDREPYGYDYHRVSKTSPWKTMIGRYTREGDVRALVKGVDDLFVVSRPGDEIALSFAALPPPPAGQIRTFLLYAHGYSKEMNPRSAIPDTVAPLPFRGMSGYPYRADEHYPRTKRHREYLEKYNTRVVTRAIPSIDAAYNSEHSPGGAPAVHAEERTPR